MITGIIAAQEVNLCQDFNDQRVLIEMDIDAALGRFNHLFNNADMITDEFKTGIEGVYCFMEFCYDGRLTARLQTKRWNLRFDLTTEGMLYFGADFWGDSFDMETDWVEMVAPIKWFMGLPIEHDRVQ